jgi:xylose isomerase
MSRSYFDTIAPIAYRGPGSTDPLSFRWYDKDRRVLGKRMEDHLRFAVCYWHSFVWTGGDPFGGDDLRAPLVQGGTPMAQAARKAEAAFAFFEKLGAPYYCFHDRDVAPEGATPRESDENFRAWSDVLGEHQQRTGVKLLWGTANLFSHRRFMAGAATNPDPELFAMAAACRSRTRWRPRWSWAARTMCCGAAAKATRPCSTPTSAGARPDGPLPQLGGRAQAPHRLQGHHPDRAQAARAVQAPVRLRRRHGLRLPEAATAWSARSRSTSRPTTPRWPGHSFEHEIALARRWASSADRHEPRRPAARLGHRPVPQQRARHRTGALRHLQGTAGWAPAALNFDAKVRRQSIDPADLFHGPCGRMDVCARALLVAEKMMQDGQLESLKAARYAGWDSEEGRAILDGRRSLAELADQVLETHADPQPVSARQEFLENLVNRYTEA